MIGRPQPAYEKSVFINCPFDSDYRDLMLASVFSVSAHGLAPRSARETEATGGTALLPHSNKQIEEIR
jgi:hypothetical protein